MSINLSRFCFKKDKWTQPSMDFYTKPWSEGEYTYATDRIIMIRVPRVAEIPDKKGPSKALEYFNEFPTDPSVAYLDLPASDCPECDGKGFLVFHSNCFDYEVSCRSCKKSANKETDLIDIGGVNFQRKFVRLLRSLPNCKIAVRHIDKGPSRFVFEGGEGLLMPVRV